ncbi:DUF4383 domain-containing protein [Glutamicibacter sp.]|jgi:hypothetical protein|uniref:DUF4383 domain-containing protein n=1 Tax=Glutamicibacter sp. TaxID=1931995 RepID=UPI002B486B69|nr:DUF4383 domain-containing protein [Glutamicibacter sp.]HJX77070.1 DUF4383 domain-containing protein [Glutamicibacter sp.]
MNVRRTPSDIRSAVEKASLLIGVVFLIVGILGFIPGVTTNYDSLSGAGHHSEAKLLGIFQVSYLHNAVHLLFGIAGLVMARSIPAAKSYLAGGGFIYLLLWIYGLIIDFDGAANFIPLNDADNWLHLFLGAGMMAFGLFLTRDGTAPEQRDSRPISG